MKILIAVSMLHENDCGDPIAAVASFPWPPQTTFRVLTVAGFVHPPVAGLMAGSLDVTDVQQAVDAESRDVATMAAVQLREHGLVADIVTQEGDPESVIVEHAKSWGADLIVVGECHRSAVARLLIGSVSHSVVKHAHCSVLVVKPAHGEADERTHGKSDESVERQPTLV
jgi:nucleotide-binding universal stress UspA family protein